MARLDSLEAFLASGATQINPLSIASLVILSALLSFVLSKIYIRYGTSLSNRKKFASNFVLLATTTTLIITIVKSSLALSLGLVGALSIVRFRAAIKEPEELAFLFLCIAIGLGMGAAQVLVTVVSFIIIALLIVLRHFSLQKDERQNLHLTVSGKNVALSKIVGVVKKNALSAHLKRFDQSQHDGIEASFSVDLASFESLERLRTDLKKISKNLEISYLDKSGIW